MDEVLLERHQLAVGRIKQIEAEKITNVQFQPFFQRTAAFISMIFEVEALLCRNAYRVQSLKELEKWNERLYADILPEAYGSSYGNPVYAVEKLGEEHGRLLCFLYGEIRAMIVLAFENRKEEVVSLAELFIEIYNLYEEEMPEPKEVKDTLYWFISDYADVTVKHRVLEQLYPEQSMATEIIMEAELTKPDYLYYFGEYVTESEKKTAAFLNALPKEKIETLARTFTEGYRIGFIRGGKDISKKKVVNIRYNLGFERVVREAILQFQEMGLEPVIYRAAALSINRNKKNRIGFYGAIPNKQYDYDHKGDAALYLDKAFVERKLGVLRTTYENNKEQASLFGGPACMEIFGEEPFSPENCKEALRLSEKQQKLDVYYQQEAGKIVNAYIRGEERSFTIIAWPVPAIGEPYDEIFREIVKINTLDYKLYETIQQTLIDALDEGVSVEIKGMAGNRTDLTVALAALKNPEKETLFENCVADVNIPVGEVFTSPKLAGTNGVLHVSRVFLNELEYKDMEIVLKDGMVDAYTCKNFPQEKDNQAYIQENVLYHHETLPLGEFAIGTNTTAYMAAKKYDIAAKLPILIAEKMGPHFALGDTCFSWEEDTPTYNPNGKEIIAKENEVSRLRKEDLSKAYCNCHTDITIPYDELGELTVVRADGSRQTLIKEGRFTLPGTEKLNEPLEEV